MIKATPIQVLLQLAVKFMTPVFMVSTRDHSTSKRRDFFVEQRLLSKSL